MSIASVTVPAAFTPFQNFFRWLGTSHGYNWHKEIPARLAAPALPACRPVTPPAFLRQRAAIKRVGNRMNGDLSMQKTTPVVRVVRMLESGQSPKAVGRMVISGRMADVCAELDRLVSREETVH